MSIFEEVAQEFSSGFTLARKFGFGSAPPPPAPTPSVFDEPAAATTSTSVFDEPSSPPPSVKEAFAAIPPPSALPPATKPYPFPPKLVRREGDRPESFLSQERGGLRTSRTPATFQHLPAEATAPVPEFAPTTFMDEGRTDLPHDYRSDSVFERGHQRLGGAVNSTIDLAKNLVGGLADPETALGVLGPGALLKGKSLLSKKPLAPPPGSPELVPPSSSGQRLLTSSQELADDAAHQGIPPPPPPLSGARDFAGPGGGGGGRTVPTRFDPPESLTIGPGASHTFHPWSPNYDVFVSDWRDPNLSAWEKVIRTLPADLAIAMKVPESPVIGVLDKPAVHIMNWTDELVRSPMMKELNKLDADLFVTEEAKAYAMWSQSRRPSASTSHMIPPQPGQVGMQIVGQSPAKSFDDIMQVLDPRVVPWFKLFRDRMLVDQQSRATLGLSHLDEVPYPYLPRIMQEDWDRLMTVQRGNSASDAVSGMSTSLKGFQQARAFPTMSDGIAGGMAYQDPKRAILMRLTLSKQMEYTAAMMQELRGTVMFPTREAAMGEVLRRRQVTELSAAQSASTRMTRPPGTPLPENTPFTDPTHLREPALRPSAAPLPPPRVTLPLSDPVAVRGLPGDSTVTWWVPSKQEALALHQHLTGGSMGGLFGQTSAVINQFFRNPNLMNPAPHVIKNMGYKYVIASSNLQRNPVGALKDLAGYTLRMPADLLGDEVTATSTLGKFFQKGAQLVVAPLRAASFGRLVRDADEFVHNTNPLLVGRFVDQMPFSKNAQTAYENLKPFLETNKYWSATQTAGKYLTGNSYSSKYIFSQADPAMKYSLWKQYVERGLSDTAAANQVNVDLVRYTLRSELVDMWKNVPFNFFVPWRVGTIMATAKQLSSDPWRTVATGAGVKVPLYALTRPFKTSLLIGAVMMGREAYYRQTGSTFHLPFDYIDGPIAKIIDDPSTAPGIAASMLMLGPGGDIARTTQSLHDVARVMMGKEDWSKLLEMYWGISQIYGSGAEFARFATSLNEKGVEGADYSALAHVLMGAALAEYESYGYTVKHVEHWMSEGLIPYDPNVLANLTANAARHHAGELRHPLKQQRQDAIKKSQHDRVHPPQP